MRTPILAGTAFALTACSPSDQSIAKQHLAAVTRDPASIQVRNIHQGSPMPDTDKATTKIICGEWNAKNGFGGYGEWQRFIDYEPSGTVVTEGSPDDSYPDITARTINFVCGG